MLQKQLKKETYKLVKKTERLMLEALQYILHEQYKGDNSNVNDIIREINEHLNPKKEAHDFESKI